MRLYSNLESAEAGEPSVLAIVETILAVSLSIWIAWYYDTMTHIAVGTCIAPFLLLRTPESTNVGLSYLGLIDSGRILRFARTGATGWKVMFYLFFYYLLAALVLKVAVTLLALVLMPAKTVAFIPENWRRIVVATDANCEPELMPGLSRYSDTAVGYFLRYSGPLEAWRESLGRRTEIRISLAFAHFFKQVWFLPPIAYRWSLKSTSIVWLPLLYVVNHSLGRAPTVQARLEVLRTSTWSKFIRALSAFILVSLALKVCVLPSVIQWWNSFPVTTILDFYVLPNVLHPWHIAAGVNAMLTLGVFYFFFEKAPIYLKDGTWSEEKVDKTWRAFSFVRGCLSIYTIAVGLYLTIKAAMRLKYPEVEWTWFPW